MTLPQTFLDVAHGLTEKLHVVPVLYGSVGLSRALGSVIEGHDIDMLVPRIFITTEWPKLRVAMEELGFRMVDSAEHEFDRDGVRVGFGYEEDLLPFAGVDAASLTLEEEAGVAFRSLSIEAYRAVYSKSALDGYRRDRRGKKDAEKLALIAANQKVDDKPAGGNSE